MFEQEIKIGKEAVMEAMGISRTIQEDLSPGDSITKGDRSPVTIADFTCQAIICRILHRHFPRIPIVGEESSRVLKDPANEKILKKIEYYIELDPGDLLECIDFGNQSPADVPPSSATSDDQPCAGTGPRDRQALLSRTRRISGREADLLRRIGKRRIATLTSSISQRP